MSAAADVVVITAHPQMEHSRITRALNRAASSASSDTNPTIAVRDLYALYPDYLIDTAAEQTALRSARLIVWLHPIHWYHMPPLMKLWLDEVLAFGWAYGPGGDALRGKDLWLVASTGGPAESYQPNGYNRYAFDAFLPPYEQTAALCGMRFLPPMLLHDAHRIRTAELDEQTATFAQRLRSHPDWPELTDLEACPACEVPVHARPDRESAESP
jgi:glutathione-regulated potassium-efflux system ancillary protein KefF